MEKLTIAGYNITTWRKNNTKLVLSLRDKAIEMLRDKSSLGDISIELERMLKENVRNTRVCVSMWRKSNYNESEKLYIRDSSQDCTYVSIIPKNFL